jgi:transposase-like protein
MKLQCPKCGSFSIMDFGSFRSKFATYDESTPNFRYLKYLKGDEISRFKCKNCNHQFDAKEWIEHKKIN